MPKDKSIAPSDFNVRYVQHEPTLWHIRLTALLRPDAPVRCLPGGDANIHHATLVCILMNTSAFTNKSIGKRLLPT